MSNEIIISPKPFIGIARKHVPNTGRCLFCDIVRAFLIVKSVISFYFCTVDPATCRFWCKDESERLVDWICIDMPTPIYNGLDQRAIDK